MNVRWIHSKGAYRRSDGKGIVLQTGSHDWAASADVGDGMQSVGIGRSGSEACGLVDDAISSGKIDRPEVTPGTFVEQVREKIRRAGLSQSISVRKRGTDGVALGVGDTFDVVIRINEWGMKPGQQSYQVLCGKPRRLVSNHDDERWRYPQKGELALDAAVVSAVEAVMAQGFGKRHDEVRQF